MRALRFSFLFLVVATSVAWRQTSPEPDSIFTDRLPAGQLSFLLHDDGVAVGTAIKAKPFWHTVDAEVPQAPFHYGNDMPLEMALQETLNGSKHPVQIRDGRFAMIATDTAGRRGFAWADLQSGVVLGGIYFHPSNGEPTPTLTIFSREVDRDQVKMSDLPPAFATDLTNWLQDSRLPLVTPRYMITGANIKVLLEHDEDFCAPANGAPAPADCAKMNADAAQIDLDSAYYLEQTHYATNATARMIEGQEEIDWIGVRERTCVLERDPMACRVRLTHEQIHRVIRRVPVRPVRHHE